MSSILIAVPVIVLNARTGTGASATFGLPTRLTLLSYQTSFNVAPAVIDIDIDISIDGINWTTIDTTTAVGGEVRTITNPTAALFVRANVITNTGNRQVTLTLVAKVEAFLQSLEPYIQLSDTTNQVPALPDTATQATFDTEDTLFGFTHVGGDITILKSGTYLVTVLGHMDRTGGGVTTVLLDMWFRVNATDVLDSVIQSSILSSSEIKTITKTIILNLVTGDVLKVMFEVNNETLGVGFYSAGTVFGGTIPSVALSATRLG